MYHAIEAIGTLRQRERSEQKISGAKKKSFRIPLGCQRYGGIALWN